MIIELSYSEACPQSESITEVNQNLDDLIIDLSRWVESNGLSLNLQKLHDITQSFANLLCINQTYI